MMASLLWQQPAASAPDPQVHQPVVACVDAKATYALTDRKRAARYSSRWRARVQRLGRCFTIQPEEHWERISSIGGLVLMRRTPPQPGLPPLYFRADAPAVAPRVADDPPARRSQPVSPPVLKAPSWAVRARASHPDDAIPQVQSEPLPPPAAAAPAIPPIPPAAGLPDARPPDARLPDARLPDARLPDAGPTVPAAAPPARSGVVPVPPGSSAAYGIGFAAAILLTAGLLVIMGLLMRGLLLWSPKRTPPALPQKRLPPEPRQSPKPLQAIPRTHGVIRWSLPIAAVPNMLQPAGQLSMSHGWLPDDEFDAQRRCALMLRDAGWDAHIRPSFDGHPADVVARRGGRVMALRCLPAGVPVDEQAVEAVCVARERERADLAVIVSNAVYTDIARQLAAHIGIDLLDENQLRAFAG